ncbi:MAG TPA: metallophosphoesterase [Candidatus Eisenbacteria bacterium]
MTGRADVVFTADLHGHRPFYGQALELARSLRARALLLGGDLAPHADPREQRAFFADFLIPCLRDYRSEPEAAEVHFVLGNDDWRSSLPLLLNAGLEGLHHAHLAVRPLAGEAWVAGLASVTATPFGMKDWDRWEEGLPPTTRRTGYRSDPDGSLRPFDFTGREEAEGMLRDLEAIQREEGGARDPLVCLFHGPPFGTALDQIRGGIHVGSREIRAYLERRHPLVALHGHIHEAPDVSGRFFDRLGRTICVNPGQRLGARLHAVWFSLGDVAGTLTHSIFGPAGGLGRAS